MTRKRYILIAVGALAAVALAVVVVKLASRHGVAVPTRPQPLRSVAALSAKYGARFRIRESNARPYVLNGDARMPLRPGETEEAAARRYLDELSIILKIDTRNLDKALPVVHALGTSYHFPQVLQHVIVEGSEVSVDRDKDGNFFLVTSSYKDLPPIDVKPSVDAAEAKALMKATDVSGEPELVVHFFDDGKPDLAWRIKARRSRGPDQPTLYYVNAHTRTVETASDLVFDDSM
jgi:hypothetical protein